MDGIIHVAFSSSFFRSSLSFFFLHVNGKISAAFRFSGLLIQV